MWKNKKSFRNGQITFSEVFSDNFNRADGALGGNWIFHPNYGVLLEIVGNQVQKVGGATNRALVWDSRQTNDSGNQYSEADFYSLQESTAGSTDGLGLLLRSNTSGTNNWYSCTAYLVGGVANFNLFKVVNGSGSTITTYTATYVDGARLRFEAIDTMFRVTYNGVLLGLFIDNSIAAGKFGIRGGINTSLLARLDNWSGGNIILNST
jgi:hypothetical protein